MDRNRDQKDQQAGNVGKKDLNKDLNKDKNRNSPNTGGFQGSTGNVSGEGYDKESGSSGGTTDIERDSSVGSKSSDKSKTKPDFGGKPQR